MAIAKKLINYLAQKKINYELIEHRIVFTAWDLVKTLHLKKPEEVAKTLLVKMDKEPVIVLLPANKNLDKAKFKKIFNAWRKKQNLKIIKDIDFFKEAWMKKNIKIGKLGVIPPFSQLLKMPVFVDNLVLKPAKIIVNSGEYGVSLKIKTKDFVKAEQPVKGSFSKKK
ncbi:MAG: YbaK/EbsC family protein [Patescibacteria group bacterium]|jgi:prolyl-tRNA editing enzyme YbaK/EbsC (Cys-tRNA(Pro) deacylase)|nr:YbaK/EbsC family protein [Patescibacteria group bacterium]MDD5172957.1 YbaK/EbsC family protein [Patescibacteria group bacterium]